MRKLIALFTLCLFVGVGSIYAYDDPSIRGWKNKSDIAQHSWEQTTELKWVRNGQMGLDTTQIVSRDVVVYSTTSDDGVSVSLTTTSADGAIAGIAVVTIPTSDQTTVASYREEIGRRNWGWILVHGKTFAKVTAGGSNNHAAGDIFFTSADSGAVTTSATTAPNTASLLRQLGGKGGIFLDAVTATGTVEEVQVQLE